MANGGLRSVREALLLPYGTNVIDSVEFAVFYDANSSRELFSYWKFDKFNFDDWAIPSAERNYDSAKQKSSYC